MASSLLNVYRAAVLRRPWLALLAVVIPIVVMASFLPGFELNVSSDALILEKDPALRIYDESRLVFGSDDYVIIAFEADDVFDEKSVRLIASLTRDLSAIEGVDRVLSLTSASLFTSPKRGSLLGVMMSGGDPITLDADACDRALARRELTESGIYADNLVTPDGTKTALLVYLLQRSEGHGLERRIHAIDRILAGGEGAEKALGALKKEREELRAKPSKEEARAAEIERLLRGDRKDLTAWREETNARFQVIVAERRTRREKVVGDIRKILAPYEAEGTTFHSSGLPVIFTDMMTYVRRDITLFGSLVAGFLVLVLGVVFRKLRWVVLPMAAGLGTVGLVLGTMVAAGIQTTVITSNLTSLLMILTMAHSIHFAVRADEEFALDATAPRRDRILRAVRHIGTPCFYIACTTAVGFVSLIISGIRPVIEFGQYMALGVLLAFIVTFVLVPAGLAMWPFREGKARRPPAEAARGPFRPLAVLTARARWAVIVLGVGLTVFSIFGIARLDVETVFIHYFRKDTEIYRGLRFIDQKLGGTTSLEVLFTATDEAYHTAGKGGKPLPADEGYFTTWERLEPIRKVEAYMKSVPEVGKVLSPITLMEEMDRILVAYGSPHPQGRNRHGAKTLLLPLSLMGSEAVGPDQAPLYAYLDPTGRKARVFVRLRETAETLNRNRVVRELRTFLAREIDVPGVEVEVTGVFVLYANMLHSLFAGQTKTTLFVFGAILVMMIVLFRSLRLGLLAIVPNVVPILFVLGAMGWLGVNLDMNNIMVASVSLGIAVDDTLHYLFRYREEFHRDGDYVQAMVRTHNTIGKAIVLTSIVIVSGFLVLAFSNFIPTRNFGVFTSLAMVTALFAAITLLPACILVFRPFGRHPKTAEGENDGPAADGLVEPPA
ncbi:MAG: efflux RND transporter permease subunit [Planctomycetota bacterium]|jgi:predicted RND superfamily exporter protein